MTHLSIVGIAGNLARPSKTRTLVAAVLNEISERGLGETHCFDLVDAGPELGATLTRESAPPRVDRMLTAIENADLLVAATPVYKASYTGLFKHVFDLLDPKALAGHRVILGATAGSDRHALMIEHQLRPLFAFFGAQVLPVSLYAMTSDFDTPDRLSPSFRSRVIRAVDQIAGPHQAGRQTLRLMPLIQNVA